MPASGSSTILHDTNDFLPNESTPLVSPASVKSKRIRSYTNTLQFSKRRLHPKSRFFKPLDKLYINANKDTDNGSDNQHGSTSSSTTVFSSGAGSQDDGNKHPSSSSVSSQSACSLESPPLNAHNQSLLSCISLTLENSGSVARDHLASERTFLAYVRTSIAIASSGVALVQLFIVASANLRHEHRLHTYIRPLGASTIVMGLIVLIIGVTRYFSVQAALTKGNFPVARVVTAFITSTLTLLVVVTFGILVSGKLEPSKRT